MQSDGQYGLSEMQQFVLGRTAPRLYGQDLAAAQSPHLRQQVQQIQHQHHHAQQQQVHQRHHLAHVQFQPHQQLLQQSLSLAHQHQIHQSPNQQQQQQQHRQHHHHVQLLVPCSDSTDLAAPTVTTPRPPPSNPNTRPFVTEKDVSIEDDGAAEEGERGGSCNRWPIEETISLLRIRSEMDAIFRDSGVKGPLWEEVSRKLGELGYHRSARNCKEKFENVHKYYKKTKDGKAGRQDGKSYRFFTELEALYSSPTITNLNSDSNGTLKACMRQGYGGTTDQEGLPIATVRAAARSSSGLNRSSDTSSQNADDNEEENENDNQEEEEVVEEEDDDIDNNDGEGYELDGGVEKCEEEERSRIRKRKRRSWSGMKAFFEKLVKQVTEQQEALHKKFLETIERLDQERVMREEAYRRQEEARLNREHELRAQEHAMAATRDAALVAFLQKITGHSLKLPHMPPPPFLDSTLSNTHHELDLQDKELSDFTAKRWPKVEVHALIRLRSGMEPRFQEAGPKSQLWEEISASMSQMGYHRSAKRCKEKWENINKYFRKTKDSCKKRPENAKTCPYFHFLDTLYQKGILNSPNSNKCGIIKGEGQSDNLLENSREADDHMIQDGSGTAEMMAIVNSGGESNPGILTAMEDVTDHGAAHVMETNDTPPAPPTLNFNGFEGLSNKSVKMEGFVKEILDLQQQQHQKLMEEYERMEHAREIRDQERRQQQQEIHLAQQRAPSSTRDNAALMALVHKLDTDPSDFRLVGSSSPG